MASAKAGGSHQAGEDVVNSETYGDRVDGIADLDCEGLQGGSGQLGAQNLVPGRVEPQEPGVRSSFGSLRPDIHVSKGRRVGVLCF